MCSYHPVKQHKKCKESISLSASKGDGSDPHSFRAASLHCVPYKYHIISYIISYHMLHYHIRQNEDEITEIKSHSEYRKTSNRSPRLLLEHFTSAPGFIGDPAFI